MFLEISIIEIIERKSSERKGYEMQLTSVYFCWLKSFIDHGTDFNDKLWNVSIF